MILCCIYCKKELKSLVGLKCHQKKCSYKNPKLNRRPMKNCGFCGKKYYIDNHLDRCTQNPDKIKYSSKGLNYEEIYGKDESDKIKNKIRNSLIGKSTGKGSTKEIEELRRKRISEKMKLVGGGYRQGSGRGKKGRYKGFWCDSSYELAYVIYCIDHNIDIKRNWKKFPYIFEKRNKTWIPDFIKPNGEYVEIKGYMNEQNKAKISQFQYSLEVLCHPKIDPILEYVKLKYGKDFINLYE